MGVLIVKPLLDAPVGTYLMFIDTSNIYRKEDLEYWISVSGTNKGYAFIARNFQNVMEQETWALS